MLKKFLVKLKKSYLLKISCCKMKGCKVKLLLNEESLIIKQRDNLYRVMCDSIEKVKLAEKLWSIRVSFMYQGEKYAFDFSNLKKAKAFYEKLIYCKVKGQVQ